MSRLKLMGEFLDAIKNGFRQSPPAVRGRIPDGYTLESYQEALDLGLFDNGASPEEVLEMMRQNGTIGRLEGLKYHDGTSDIDRMRSGINERVGEMNKLTEPDFLVRKRIQSDPSNMPLHEDVDTIIQKPNSLLTDTMKDLNGLGEIDYIDWRDY